MPAPLLLSKLSFALMSFPLMGKPVIMKTRDYILICCFTFFSTIVKALPAHVYADSVPPAQQEKLISADEAKFGFKNLFKQFTYNPAIPYASQVNPHAEAYMQSYLAGHTHYLQNLRKTAVPYFNFIDNILSQYRLPRELKYLAVIESDLKSTATSWVGARGPWQFMTYTAQGLGLKINNQVDERTDYEKSTHAAARYLLSLYHDLNDWLLVIAAYNGGTGRVYSAIRKSGSRDFWKLQYYLPEESRNHVKKFIATHYIMEAVGSTSFDYKQLQNPTDSSKANLTEAQQKAEVTTISGKYKADIIARNIGMNKDAFNVLNPSLDKVLASGGEYSLRLPADKMQLFVEKRYAILNECIQELMKGF
jgi:membrane-bound lytic murein transglycosylase D